MKKNKLWLVLIPVVLVAVVLIGAAGFILVQNDSSDAYSEAISLAKTYIEEQNYEGAIAAYEQAIALDQTKTTAYEGLARIYQAQGDAGKLEQIIVLYERNNNDDATMRNKYGAELETLLLQEKEKQAAASAEEAAMEAELLKAQETTQVNLDSSVLNFIAGASYGDYLSQYGQAAIENTGNTSVLTYQNPPIVCTYAPEGGTSLVDSSGTPYSSSCPTSVSFTDLSFIFVGMTGQTTLETLEAETALENVTVVESDGTNYVQFQVKNCQVKIQSDENGNISGPDAWNQVTFTRTEEENDTCTLTGAVIDATTGDGVVEAKIRFRAGFGSETGTVVYEKVSDFSGDYMAEVEPGEYTVEISAADYITEYYEVTVYSWFASDEKDFVLSPELEEGQIRIVLEWGSYPRDLDSYLQGTASDGSSVNVNFIHSKEQNNSGEEVANLDVDCMSGYGPETTTILDIGGSYTFFVNDFGENGVLGQSGATVKIYMPGADQPELVTIPDNIAYVWNVCRIENGVLTILNEEG